jgi:lipoyl(octanoyl) transferase
MQDIEYKIDKNLTFYNDAISFMEHRVSDIIANKAPECLWLVEHPPLYTAGTSAQKQDLLDANRFPVYETGRGGQYTYHGPGQRVGYVMIDLKQRNAQDIKKYVYDIEQWIINTLAVLKIEGQRRVGRVGIWVVLADNSEAKIAAVGIRVRKWVTYHGIALNISPDLSHYKGIVPCGILQYGVTSLKDLNIDISVQEVDKILIEEFKNIFFIKG